MSLLTHLECSRCARREDAARLAGVCPDCGAPLLARYDLAAGRHVMARTDLPGRPAGLWRISELMPPAAPADRVTLGEGGTPLLPAPRLAPLAGGAAVFVKDESQTPTLSFKCRGMAVAVTAARARGVRRMAVPSAGNAGGALAAYAARAGIEACVVLPDDTPPAFAADARRHGARVEMVPGTIADAGRRVAALREEGWFDTATFREPYRLEGKKTLGFEIAIDLGFRYPDWIVYPTGGGTGLVGMWKAFAELEAVGWISGRKPRMAAVQAEGCAPIARAFLEGKDAAVVPETPATRAWGLRVPRPLADRMILAALRESGGTALTVSERELEEGAAELALLEGIDACPEGGAAWAGARALAASGLIVRGETVVVVNTGSGAKYREAAA